MDYFEIPCVRKSKYFLKKLPVRYNSLNRRGILTHEIIDGLAYFNFNLDTLFLKSMAKYTQNPTVDKFLWKLTKRERTHFYENPLSQIVIVTDICWLLPRVKFEIV